MAEDARRGQHRHGGLGREGELAKAHGYKHVINYSTENFVEKVKAITGGKSVPVVYDSVGKTTWDGSLDSLQPRGLLVSFGNASGPVPPVNLGILSTKGSLYVTRPTLATYIAARADLGQALERSSTWSSPESEDRDHEALQARRRGAGAPRPRGRKTTGSVVLVPLDAEDLLRLAEGGHRLGVLAGLVKLLAFGAQLLHFRHLLVVELGLRQRGVDRLQLVRAVVGEAVRKRGRAAKRRCVSAYVASLENRVRYGSIPPDAA